MSVSLDKVNSDDTLTFFNQHGTQHDALNKAFHGKTFHGGIFKCSVLYLVDQHVSRGIKKQPELVDFELAAGHAIRPQAFQVF
nr:hypothetical protein [Bacteroides sp. UBA939]